MTNPTPIKLPQDREPWASGHYSYEMQDDLPGVYLNALDVIEKLAEALEASEAVLDYLDEFSAPFPDNKYHLKCQARYLNHQALALVQRGDAPKEGG